MDSANLPEYGSTTLRRHASGTAAVSFRSCTATKAIKSRTCDGALPAQEPAMPKLYVCAYRQYKALLKNLSGEHISPARYSGQSKTRSNWLSPYSRPERELPL
jgi:hypothetical protein